MRETTGQDFDSYVKNEEWDREQETAQREQERETEMNNHHSEATNKMPSFGHG